MLKLTVYGYYWLNKETTYFAPRRWVGNTYNIIDDYPYAFGHCSQSIMNSLVTWEDVYLAYREPGLFVKDTEFNYEVIDAMIRACDIFIIDK